jgi:hypothetical protein
MPFDGASQAVSQAPQFCGSVARLTQAEPHSLKPSPQASPHLPSVQVAEPFVGMGQAMPHEPQLSGLEVVSMHEPLQFMRPPAQPAVHLPESQTWAAEQEVLQSPQRAGSFDTSTQAPPHSWKPAAHSTPHTPS